MCLLITVCLLTIGNVLDKHVIQFWVHISPFILIVQVLTTLSSTPSTSLDGAVNKGASTSTQSNNTNFKINLLKS